MTDLTAALHTRGFRFGIYTAAGYTTCGRRAGTLYHEYADAARFKAWGVDYLKYDDCGEANIQSYAKYFVMKDALAVAYAGSTPIDYYSYEPFQVYGNDAVRQMAWVSDVGDLWRTGGDIRAEWRSVLANARSNNEWAPNSRPGHFNDADMLEVRRYKDISRPLSGNDDSICVGHLIFQMGSGCESYETKILCRDSVICWRISLLRARQQSFDSARRFGGHDI